MLDLDLLTPKSNQHIYEPKYTCGQNWLKFSPLVFQIGGYKVFRLHTLTDGQTHL